MLSSLFSHPMPWAPLAQTPLPHEALESEHFSCTNSSKICSLDDNAYHNNNNQAFIPLSGDNLVDNACMKKKTLHLDLYHAVYCSEAQSGADISMVSCMIDSSGAW